MQIQNPCPKCGKRYIGKIRQQKRAAPAWPGEPEHVYNYTRYAHSAPKHIRPSSLLVKIDAILEYAHQSHKHGYYRKEMTARLEKLREYANRKTMRTYCYIRINPPEIHTLDTPVPSTSS